MKSADYDGDFLYYLTAALTEESENVSEDDICQHILQKHALLVFEKEEKMEVDRGPVTMEEVAQIMLDMVVSR